jgi:hypothetical protein
VSKRPATAAIQWLARSPVYSGNAYLPPTAIAAKNLGHEPTPVQGSPE